MTLRRARDLLPHKARITFAYWNQMGKQKKYRFQPGQVEDVLYGEEKLRVFLPYLNSSATLPVEYMTCNHRAFEPGDQVLVYADQCDYSKMKVIAFLEGAKDCGHIYGVAQGTAVTQDNVVGVYIGHDAVVSFDFARYYYGYFWLTQGLDIDKAFVPADLDSWSNKNVFTYEFGNGIPFASVKIAKDFYKKTLVVPAERGHKPELKNTTRPLNLVKIDKSGKASVIYSSEEKNIYHVAGYMSVLGLTADTNINFVYSKQNGSDKLDTQLVVDLSLLDNQVLMVYSPGSHIDEHDMPLFSYQVIVPYGANDVHSPNFDPYAFLGNFNFFFYAGDLKPFLKRKPQTYFIGYAEPSNALWSSWLDSKTPKPEGQVITRKVLKDGENFVVKDIYQPPVIEFGVVTATHNGFARFSDPPGSETSVTKAYTDHIDILVYDKIERTKRRTGGVVIDHAGVDHLVYVEDDRVASGGVLAGTKDAVTVELFGAPPNNGSITFASKHRTTLDKVNDSLIGGLFNNNRVVLGGVFYPDYWKEFTHKRRVCFINGKTGVKRKIEFVGESEGCTSQAVANYNFSRLAPSGFVPEEPQADRLNYSYFYANMPLYGIARKSSKDYWRHAMIRGFTTYRVIPITEVQGPLATTYPFQYGGYSVFGQPSPKLVRKPYSLGFGHTAYYYEYQGFEADRDPFRRFDLIAPRIVASGYDVFSTRVNIEVGTGTFDLKKAVEDYYSGVGSDQFGKFGYLLSRPTKAVEYESLVAIDIDTLKERVLLESLYKEHNIEIPTEVITGIFSPLNESPPHLVNLPVQFWVPLGHVVPVSSNRSGTVLFFYAHGVFKVGTDPSPRLFAGLYKINPKTVKDLVFVSPAGIKYTAEQLAMSNGLATGHEVAVGNTHPNVLAENLPGKPSNVYEDLVKYSGQLFKNTPTPRVNLGPDDVVAPTFIEPDTTKTEMPLDVGAWVISAPSGNELTNADTGDVLDLDDGFQIKRIHKASVVSKAIAETSNSKAVKLDLQNLEESVFFCEGKLHITPTAPVPDIAILSITNISPPLHAVVDHAFITKFTVRNIGHAPCQFSGFEYKWLDPDGDNATPNFPLDGAFVFDSFLLPQQEATFSVRFKTPSSMKALSYFPVFTVKALDNTQHPPEEVKASGSRNTALVSMRANSRMEILQEDVFTVFGQLEGTITRGFDLPGTPNTTLGNHSPMDMGVSLTYKLRPPDPFDQKETVDTVIIQEISPRMFLNGVDLTDTAFTWSDDSGIKEFPYPDTRRFSGDVFPESIRNLSIKANNNAASGLYHLRARIKYYHDSDPDKIVHTFVSTEDDELDARLITVQSGAKLLYQANVDIGFEPNSGPALDPSSLRKNHTTKIQASVVNDGESTANIPTIELEFYSMDDVRIKDVFKIISDIGPASLTGGTTGNVRQDMSATSVAPDGPVKVRYRFDYVDANSGHSLSLFSEFAVLTIYYKPSVYFTAVSRGFFSAPVKPLDTFLVVTVMGNFRPEGVNDPVTPGEIITVDLEVTYTTIVDGIPNVVSLSEFFFAETNPALPFELADREQNHNLPITMRVLETFPFAYTNLDLTAVPRGTWRDVDTNANGFAKLVNPTPSTTVRVVPTNLVTTSAVKDTVGSVFTANDTINAHVTVNNIPFVGGPSAATIESLTWTAILHDLVLGVQINRDVTALFDVSAPFLPQIVGSGATGVSVAAVIGVRPFTGALEFLQVTGLPANGKLHYGGGTVSAGQVISAADITSGKLTFVPVAHQKGSPYTTFTFRVGDGTVFPSSDTTMAVNVTVGLEAATAINNTVSMNEDTTYTFGVTDFNFVNVDVAFSKNISFIPSVQYHEGVDTTSRKAMNVPGIEFTIMLRPSGMTVENISEEP